MLEYITKKYYDKDGLVIGTNGKSYLIGLHKEWVVIDRSDIKYINSVIKDKGLAGGMNGSVIVRSNDKKEIVLSQQNHTVRINKSLFSRTCV